jgi:diguanylate cyclase (GGDEF)-like protein/PAS domain S-box-containing protein
MADQENDNGTAGSALPADELYEALVETSGELICFIDPSGRVAFASQAAVDLLGYAPAEMKGLHFSHFLDYEDALTAEEAFRNTRGETQLQREIPARHKEGHQVHLTYNARPLIDEDGEFKGVVAVVGDITELKRLQAELERMANEDDLTGLANRRRFLEHLAVHLVHAERYGWRGAVLMVDVDGLKKVNDRLGHAAGDSLIFQVADRLRQRLRESDFLARLWGDEFAVLLPEAEADDGSRVATALVSGIAADPFQLDSGDESRATASVGVTVLAERATVDEALKRADDALYLAKSRGGDCVAFFDRIPPDETR